MYFLDPSLQIPINHGWSLIVAGVVVTGLNNTIVMPPTLSITQVQHLPCSLAAPQPQFSANYGGLFTKKLSTEHMIVSTPGWVWEGPPRWLIHRRKCAGSCQ